MVGNAIRADRDDAPRQWFYPNHLGKLILFGVVGGFPFFMYWAYRNWAAYVANDGYSRSRYWRRVREATGYRPSPFWRAALSATYGVCLFPLVDRECRARGVRGVPVPALLALAFTWMVVIQNPNATVPDVDVVRRMLISPVWFLIPVQLGVNRLHAAEGRRLRFETDYWELIWVGIGAVLLLSTG